MHSRSEQGRPAFSPSRARGRRELLRTSDLPECPTCFGELLPISVCESCNTVAVCDGLEEVGSDLACEDCGATNPTHFACSACNARFPYQDIERPVGPSCAECGSPVRGGSESCSSCGVPLAVESVVPARPKRSVRGDFEDGELLEIAGIPDVGRQLAEALCKAGYDRTWKLHRAEVGRLAKVPGVGLRTAVRIKNALETTPGIGEGPANEAVVSEEYECPLCGTVTSVFATRCHDCGVAFGEVEPSDDARTEEAGDEEKSLLAFYDVQLLGNLSDPTVHYGRAMLLFATGRAAEALTSFDRVLELRPGDAKAVQAKARSLGVARGFGMAAEILRAAVTSFEPDGLELLESLEVDAREAMESPSEGTETVECPECGGRQPVGSEVCPHCGHMAVLKIGTLRTQPEEGGPTPEEDLLLAELERAIAPEKKATPPPLKPYFSQAVIAKKRTTHAFLSKIPGVSKRAADAVAVFFLDTKQIALVDVIDIAKIPGVAPAEARLIKVAVEDLHRSQSAIPTAPRPGTSPTRTQRFPTAPFLPDLLPAPEPRIPSPQATPLSRPHRAGVPSRRPVGLEARRGLVNGSGLVNGRGRVNGLVNGRGRVNGLVNGTGLINGGAVSEHHLPRGSSKARYIAIGAALLMLFPIALALMGFATSPGIEIDGNFEDWSRERVPEYAGGTTSANANVQIAGTSISVSDTTIFLRVRVAGTPVFADPAGWDTMYGFLDLDGNNVTGYDLGLVGAEYVVRVSGSAARVEDARLLRFDGAGRTRDDWEGFVAASEVTAAASGSEVEVSVPRAALESFSNNDLRVLFAFDDLQGETSHTSVPFGASAGALIVEQVPLTTTLAGGVQPFLTLTFRSLGNVPFTVQQVTLATQGNAIFMGLPSGVLVGAGSSETRTINVDATGLPQGTLVTATVTGIQFQPVRPHSIVGPIARAHIGQPPPGKAIDGLFADWPSPMADTDVIPPRRRAMNILSRDGNVSGNQVFLYARFGGEALEGGLTPAKPARPDPDGPGNGTQSAPGGPPPPLVGQDYVRFYVDTDAATPGGYDVGGISADRLFEVRGRNGRVWDASVYRMVGSNWVRETTLDTGVGEDQIEVGATLAATSFNGTQFAVLIADWSGIADRADGVVTRGATGGGTRSSPSPPITLDVSGNGVFFLRDTNHGTEVACTHNKRATSTKGTGPVKSITLNTGESACWYLDETQGKTIPTGTWETLLDLSSSASPAYSVSIQIWNLGPNTVAETVVQCLDQTTFGDDVRCFVDSVPQKNLGGSQVVRVLVAYASGSGTVTIEYDDADTTGDSRATLPIPEFGEVGVPIVVAVLLVVAVTARRWRRRAAASSLGLAADPVALFPRPLRTGTGTSASSAAPSLPP